jgi:hypothetical protein
MRAGVDIATSQWYINSTNIDPYPLPPSEIYNQNLIAIGNANIDFGTSGVHAGCVSLWHFLKYYFCHILSLENLSGEAKCGVQVYQAMVQLLISITPPHLTVQIPKLSRQLSSVVAPKF